MRILQLTDFYYPPHIGGLERHVALLGQELARRGHRSAVAVPATDQPGYSRDRDVHLYRLNGWSHFLDRFAEDPDKVFHPTMPDPGLVRELARVIEVERPDVIHVHGWILYSLLALRNLHGSKIVVYLHDYALVCPKRTLLLSDGTVCKKASLSRCVRCVGTELGWPKAVALSGGLSMSAKLHRRVDCFIADSSAVAAASARATHGVPLVVIPEFVPDDVTSDATHERPAFLPESDGYVLFVGALGAFKGLFQLLAAAEGLPAAVVAIGARRADTPEVLPPNTRLSTDVPHDQVMAAFAGAAVAVVPSVWAEPFGQVAVEAMAAGKPVVASRIGGLVDIIVDGETGVLVPPGDVPALRAAIAGLLADPARAVALGEAGRRRAPRFMLSQVTDRIEELFETVIAGGRVGTQAGSDVDEY